MSETVQVYLSECDTWSDGEEYHEEDNNYYYDMKFFYIVKEPDYMAIYSWNAYSGDLQSGIITDWTYCMHLNQVNESTPCETIQKEEALILINREHKRLRDRLSILESWDNDHDFVSVERQEKKRLCEKIETVLLTF